MKNLVKILGLSALMIGASSCAVSMKMQGNRFESSEVYGKTGVRFKAENRGQAEVELTPDYTVTPPNSQNPTAGPAHTLTVGVGMGIQERFELGLTSNLNFTGKFQILGEPKLTATNGNISLAVIGSAGFPQESDEGQDIFTTQRKKINLDSQLFGGGLIAGYRVDPMVNFYAGPFAEFGTYNGTYETVGVSTTRFEGTAQNRGAVIGIEVGSPRLTGMIEGAWNQINSGSSSATFWVAGGEIILSF